MYEPNSGESSTGRGSVRGHTYLINRDQPHPLPLSNLLYIYIFIWWCGCMNECMYELVLSPKILEIVAKVCKEV